MADPADYDTSVISLDPRQIDGIAKALLAHAESVGDHLEAIGDAAFHLRLGWAGESAKEATEFQERWNLVMQELFGSKKNPEDGVLNVMAGTVKKVAVGFSHLEETLEGAFRTFAENLNTPGSTETPTQTPDDVPKNLDPKDSAVLEDFPN